MEIVVNLLLFVLSLLPILLFYRYQKIRKIEQFFQNFPTPPTVPFLGNARGFSSSQEFFKRLHEYTEIYGSNFHLKIGPFGHLLISSDYKFLEWLLSHHRLITKSDNLKFLQPWLGDGLVNSTGDKWKTHRRLITPAFHFKVLEQFVGIFESKGDILVENLSKMDGNKSFDVYPFITRTTLDVICETAMGTKLETKKNIESYLQNVKDMCEIFIARTSSLFLRNKYLYRFSKYHNIQEKAVRNLHNFTNSVILKRKEELSNLEASTQTEDDLGRKKKQVFLDILLQARIDGSPLSDEEIREEVDTFMFAGHDTTATATSLTLFCLAGHKDVQDKIIEEQTQIFGSNKNPEVTYANLQQMKYLEAVLKESIRLYPPVPFFGRKIIESVEWNGLTVPSGTSVVIYVRGMHFNPKYYPEPEKFKPERFENVEGRAPFSFIPFSAGPRNCIGQKYALLELKSLISKIVRNFELVPADPGHELDLTAETVLKSLNGYRIGLKKRE